MRIYSVHDFDDKSAARNLLRDGLVVVDDISGNLIDCAWEELFDRLAHAADALNLKTQRIPTPYGPVFVMRNADRISARVARTLVLAQFPAPHPPPARPRVSRSRVPGPPPAP